jgi:hypothetical protein
MGQGSREGQRPAKLLIKSQDASAVSDTSVQRSGERALHTGIVGLVIFVPFTLLGT